MINADSLLQLMRERHAIYLRRAAGLPREEWTQDPILQTYKFTNVYRELDRQTILLREGWREPYADHYNLWFAMAMARQINWWPTLADIGFPEQWSDYAANRAVATMRSRALRGLKVYTGAYMLRCDIQDDTTPDKPAYTIHKVLNPLWLEMPHLESEMGFGGANFFTWLEDIAPRERSVQKVHQWFMQYHGWGGFLSYEVVTDLMETRYLREAYDRDEWAFAGPGAVRGLNRLLGRDLNTSLSPLQALGLMQVAFAQVREEWPDEWPTLHLREIEHSLCEFDKYERVRLGQGRPRSRFTPTPQN